ncbi:MAG: hypothetical protein KDK36_20630 [Leptospiraceae bacterium]|nr:hypothetical protein [Leptospiraceae bacterium]
MGYNYSLKDLPKILWDSTGDRINLNPPFATSKISNPAVISREKSPDDKWRMYVNSNFGIQEFISTDGKAWKHNKLVLLNCSNPFIYFEAGNYYLLYEKYSIKDFFIKSKNVEKLNSKICVRKSQDLKSWEKEKILLEPNFNWQQKTNNFLTNPSMVFFHGLYYLFFSTSPVYLEELNDFYPLHIGMAAAKTIDSEFEVYPSPIIFPDKNSNYRNLASGSLKVYKTHDGLLGLETCICKNTVGEFKMSILALYSKDIFHWNYLLTEQNLISVNDEESELFLTNPDLVFHENENLFYIFFNQRKANSGEISVNMYNGKIQD